MACSGESSATDPADTGASGGDGAPSSDAHDADDASTDVLEPSDAPDSTVDVDAATDGDASACAGGDLLFPSNALADGTTQLLSFGGYLWIAAFAGVSRVPLSGGTPTKVGFGAYADLSPHGSKLLVVDGFYAYDLDPTTLEKTELYELTGTYSNYFPRTAFAGGALFVLRDDPAGTELGRVSLADKTWTSLWKGAKSGGLLHAKDRTFLFGPKGLVATVADPGSGAPGVTLPDGITYAEPLASDASATYFRMRGSTINDLFRLDHGSATPVQLMLPPWPFGFEQVATDGVRVVHASVGAGSSELTTYVLSGGAWTALPCAPAPSAFLDFAIIDAGYAYAAIRASKGGTVVRVKLP